MEFKFIYNLFIFKFLIKRILKSNDDQTRVMTPKEAIKKGANHIVIGRPITNASNISKALKEIHNSLE